MHFATSTRHFIPSRDRYLSPVPCVQQERHNPNLITLVQAVINHETGEEVKCLKDVCLTRSVGAIDAAYFQKRYTISHFFSVNIT